MNPTPLLTPQTSLTHHIKVLIDQINFPISSPNLAGKLDLYEPNWAHITQDRWVLSAISGYKLELTQMPHQVRPSQEISCSQEEHAKISQEIRELQAKGAIVEAPLTQISIVSQIFLVEKKGGDRGQ